MLEIAKSSTVVRMGNQVISLWSDTVVLAVGAKPVDRLARELEGSAPEIHTIRDCLQPGNAAQAMFGAARLALGM